MATNLSTKFNPIQISLLRLFSRPMPENELNDLRKLMVNYYSDLLEEEITKVIIEKEYTQKDFDTILNSDD